MRLIGTMDGQMSGRKSWHRASSRDPDEIDHFLPSHRNKYFSVGGCFLSLLRFDFILAFSIARGASPLLH